MPVLGIMGLNGSFHDSGACLITDDGEWVAVEEERLNRIKHSSGFPALSIEWCLRELGYRLSDLDAIGYPWDMPNRYSRYYLKTVYDFGSAADEFFLYGYKVFHYWKDQLYQDMCRWLDAPRSRLIPVRHHLAHAASTYYLSPWDDSAILVVDGVGEAESASFFVAEGNEIRTVALPMVFPASIGMLYNYVAAHLGLGTLGSSGKLMGLAPYGQTTQIAPLRNVVQIPDTVDRNSVIRFNLDYFQYHLGGGHSALSALFSETFGPPREKDAPILQRHADLAASMQLLFEEVILFLAKQLKLLTGKRKLCYAGGVALNIDANTRIREESGFEDLFIMPSAYDAGASIGAALYLHHSYFGLPRVEPLINAFKGPQYDDAAIEEALGESNTKWSKIEDPAKEAAALLAQGAVVGWFQGREEIGPRALGNRSILMDPGIPHGKDLINQKVKFREAFRPFAPAVPLDEVDQYFVNPCPSAFMLYTFGVREEWKSRLPSITHVDGSGRVQTVTREENALFFDLLKEFGRRKGYSVLLNTSFNVQGQPLVSTPQQAITLFQHSGLDALVIGPYLLTRENDRPVATKSDEVRLLEGVVDSGGSPAFEKFETPLHPTSYPHGCELANAEEREILENHLRLIREKADADTVLGKLIREISESIEEMETNLGLQLELGVESLYTLWRLLGESWSQHSELASSLKIAIQDDFLLRKKSFPGQKSAKSLAMLMSRDSDAASNSASNGELKVLFQRVCDEFDSLGIEMDLLQQEKSRLEAERISATQQHSTLKAELTDIKSRKSYYVYQALSDMEDRALKLLRKKK